ncbi:MAG TPA: class I SAM-dependent methyltransferase [Candidatus Binatia bacterium]|nr:class I SAM-dependent methyltransferase [Candidatus Binatia bacterium]
MFTSLMDELTKYNIARWKALVEADALFTRPALTLDRISARHMLDPEGRLGDIASRNVLCLACGGGRQSIAFALLNAHVTVVDLSEAQLNRDREAAARFNVDIKIVQGDMRDLSQFEEATFDIVYHSYSLSFVPDARVVFQQVARVLRRGGLYHFMCANPFILGMQESDWNGEGYTIKHRYLNGDEITCKDQEWVYNRSKSGAAIPPPREFRHTLSALISGLVDEGFIIQHVSDYSNFNPDPNAEPGTWDHFVSIAPPWLSFWASYRPDVFRAAR